MFDDLRRKKEGGGAGTNAYCDSILLRVSRSGDQGRATVRRAFAAYLASKTILLFFKKNLCLVSTYLSSVIKSIILGSLLSRSLR